MTYYTIFTHWSCYQLPIWTDKVGQYINKGAGKTGRALLRLYCLIRFCVSLFCRLYNWLCFTHCQICNTLKNRINWLEWSIKLCRCFRLTYMKNRRLRVLLRWLWVSTYPLKQEVALACWPTSDTWEILIFGGDTGQSGLNLDAASAPLSKIEGQQVSVSVLIFK